MAGPPLKPTNGPDGLPEVERALSILHGRHPEHERALREDAEARERRGAELDALALRHRQLVRTRRLRTAAFVAPVVAVVAVLAAVAGLEGARRARVDAVAEPFRGHGFSPIEASKRDSVGQLEVVAEPGCFLAVSTGATPLRITHAGASAGAASPALFCTCASERISITSAVDSRGGLALLRAESAVIGGSRAFGYAALNAASELVFDVPCREALLDAWIDAKHPPTAGPSHAPVDSPLLAMGFHVIANATSETPLVVVDLPNESCLVASSTSKGDRLAIRLKGQPEPVARGVDGLGYCAEAGATVIVTREGSGAFVTLSAPSALVGGVLGLRELSARAGVPLASVEVAASDRAWNAKQLLLASAIPEGTITTSRAPDVPSDPEARVAAWSLETKNALTFDVAAGVSESCAPDATALDGICVFSAAQRWRTPGGLHAAVGGLARSRLPAWLYALRGAQEPAAIQRARKVLALARSLGREGFVPTTLEALVELPNGVSVLGRTGEDAVVAIGVVPSEPWAYALSEDLPWDLDGPPQIAAVKALERVTLVTALKNLPPVATRRTVVFRRRVRQH